MSQHESSPIRLVPILCVKCKAPVLAQLDEVAWVCEQCGQGLLLIPSPITGPGESATCILDIFFSKDIQPGQKGRPFWVARGQVTLASRETYKGDEGRAAREFWAAPRLFFIPAWEASLDDIVSMGVSLLRNPQRMEPGSRASFLPIVTPPEDVRALAEFLVMHIEADRRDALKTVNFELKLEPYQLWVLP